MRKKRWILKRQFKLLLFVLVGLGVFWACKHWFNQEQVQVLSFERYYDGVRTVNLVTWQASFKDAEYQVNLYDQDHNKTFSATTDENVLDLTEAVFQDDERFLIEVVAKTPQGQQISSDLFSTTWKPEITKVNLVKSNRASGNLAGRKKITLATTTPDATIYYTLDGSDPAVYGQVYTEPLLLEKSAILTCMAKREGYLDSNVSTYSYEVTSTAPIIYLSPSTQEGNRGIRGSGYTTEEEMMNRIVDVVEKELKEQHFTVYRNKPSMTAASAAWDSKKRNVDLHLAIHSNASPDGERGEYVGIETWIYDDTCAEAKEIAEALQEAVMQVYYSRYGDRGVLYSVEMGGLRETNPQYVDNGILIELGFHDNWNDAVWIVKNVDKIGQALASAIIEYYQ